MTHSNRLGAVVTALIAMFCFTNTVVAVAPADDDDQPPPRTLPQIADELTPGILLDGSIIIDESVWVTLIGEPGRHMADAYDSLVKDDTAGAAESIRKAASFLFIAGDNALLEGKTNKKSLDSAATSLAELSRRVAKGEVKSADELKPVFSRVHLTMSRHHAAKSADAMRRESWNAAGHYLKSSANHLKRASHWAGRELKSDTTATLGDAQRAAAQLIAESGKGLETAGKLIETLGNRIERFGKAMTEKDPPTDAQPKE